MKQRPLPLRCPNTSSDNSIDMLYFQYKKESPKSRLFSSWDNKYFRSIPVKNSTLELYFKAGNYLAAIFMNF